MSSRFGTAFKVTLMSKFSYYFEMIRRINFLNTAPKVLNYFNYRLYGRRAYIPLKKYTPQIGSIFLTPRCNLKCQYCSAENVMKEGRKNIATNEATLEKIKQIMKNPLFKNCVLIDLLGGEPLLVKDFVQIIEFLSKNGHLTNVTTNGISLAEKIEALKNAGVSRISISVYDENMDHLKKNIQKINSIFPVHMSMVLTKSMLENQADEILETVKFFHQSGSLSYRFWNYRPMGVDPSLEELVDDYNQDYINLRTRLDKEIPNFCLWPEIVQTENVEKRCVQLWQRINCDMQGKMTLCCGTEEKLEGNYSNLFDTEPELLYNHSTLVDLRTNLINPKTAAPEMCQSYNLLNDLGW